MTPEKRGDRAFPAPVILLLAAAAIAALGCGGAVTPAGNLGAPAGSGTPPPQPDAAAPKPDAQVIVDPPDAARDPDMAAPPVDAAPANAAPDGPLSTARGDWARAVQVSLVEDLRRPCSSSWATGAPWCRPPCAIRS